MDLAAAPDDLFPGILKVARLGYDGKGQYRVGSRVAAEEAFADLHGVPCVLEKQVPLEREISVVVARRDESHTETFPVAENEHASGILDTSIAPARISTELARQARADALRIARELEYVGVLCVEFFVLSGDRLMVNEIAPRPHNSGHYTIDACVTSQFEQQTRILANMPLGSVAQHAPAVMLNILGEAWARRPDWHRLLSHPRAKLHLYGKTEARQGRKMGHVTCLGDTVEQALETARSIRRELAL
jgi:5-(carboxyamino)imidazole ribonucleotide synthase